MNKLLLILVLAVVYSGIARAEHDFDDMSFNDDEAAALSEQNLQQILTEFKAVEESKKECMSPLKDLAFYQRLDKKFILENRSRLLEKVSLTGYVTDQDIKDISDYNTAREPCIKQMIEGLKKIEPKLGMLMEIIQIEENIDLIEVAKKRLTIGEMNKRAKERENHAIDISMEFIDRKREESK